MIALNFASQPTLSGKLKPILDVIKKYLFWCIPSFRFLRLPSAKIISVAGCKERDGAVHKFDLLR